MRKISKEARKKMSEAQQARWAKVHARDRQRGKRPAIKYSAEERKALKHDFFQEFEMEKQNSHRLAELVVSRDKHIEKLTERLNLMFDLVGEVLGARAK